MSHPNLVALATITRREVTRILRIWAQTLVPPAGRKRRRSFEEGATSLAWKTGEH